MGTMTLYSVSTSKPLPPVIGQRAGNMFEDVWGLNDSKTINAGSTTATFSKRTITSLDLITDQSSIELVMSLEPTGIIPNGSGVGKDFNILSANKKYTIGCGFMQNRDNTFYLGCANGSSTGRYIATTPVSKNTFRYYVYKVIPTGQTEIYQNEGGIYDQNFSKSSSLVTLKETDITRVRMLLGYSAAEGTERWQQTLGMFFRPFCFEGETWFPFVNQPWKTGTSLFSCTVSYDDATKAITSVGTIESLGFSVDGVSLDVLCELSKDGLEKASFPGYFPLDNKYASFPTGYSYGQYAFPIGYFKYNGNNITPPSKKGYRPKNEYRWKIGGGNGGGANLFYLWTDGTTLYASNGSGATLFSAQNNTRIVFFRISGGGGGGGGSTWTKDGAGGGGAGCGVGWMEIPLTSTFSEGIRISLGGWLASSTITAPFGNIVYNAGGDASGRTRGVGGGTSKPPEGAWPPTWHASNINGGAGANSGGTAGGTYVSKEVYAGSSLVINNPGVNNGSSSGGAGGASVGPANGYNPEAYDGAGGCGAYNGAGNSSTWEYGGAGCFFLYF